MIRIKNIGGYEKTNPFISAEMAADYKNGVIGDVVNGKFTVGAKKGYVLMEVERGNYAYTDEFVAYAGRQGRVADLTKLNGEELQVEDVNIVSATVTVGNKLVSNASGLLVVDASATAPYIEVVSKKDGYYDCIVVAE